MSESKDPVQETADGLRTALGRLGEFFHIFDLSFFVAGAVSFGALAFSYSRLGLPSAFPFGGWVGGLAVVVACYVCGLLSFAIGRPINVFRRNIVRSTLREAVKAHGLRGEAIDRYLEAGDAELWRLYIRLWQELAARHSRTVAFTHLSRYWAMAAIYDGLGAALLLWVTVLTADACTDASLFSVRLSLTLAVGLLMAAIVCLRQGAKFYEFQVEDLVAALAVADASSRNAGPGEAGPPAP